MAQDTDGQLPGVTGNDPVIQTARKGIEIERELAASPSLKHILETARRVSDDALGDLVNADAENPKLIRELQNKARLYQQMAGWLMQAVHAGQNAEQMLAEASSID